LEGQEKGIGLKVSGFDQEVDREKTRNTPGKNRETNREMKKTGQKRG
jgi:hypothetical protein